MTEDMPLSLMHFQAEAAKLRQFEADDLAAKRPAEPQPASAPQMKRARVDAEMMASAPGSKDASESVRLENKCGQPTNAPTAAPAFATAPARAARRRSAAISSRPAPAAAGKWRLSRKRPGFCVEVAKMGDERVEGGSRGLKD
eukprot:scaffold2321_cov245-Pinguiococcus_pyrenoidosus.AAC.1